MREPAGAPAMSWTIRLTMARCWAAVPTGLLKTASVVTPSARARGTEEGETSSGTASAAPASTLPAAARRRYFTGHSEGTEEGDGGSLGVFGERCAVVRPGTCTVPSRPHPPPYAGRMAATMRAVVAGGAGPPDVLEVREVPVPEARP